MAEMCRSAIQKNIPEIAFTEHFNRKPEDICYNKYNPEPFFKDIEACRAEFGPQGLTIKAGVEVGEGMIFHFYPKETEDRLARLELAYRNRRANDIRRTFFSVDRVEGGYEFSVAHQTYLK